MYFNEKELFYEILVSKGKGKLTKKATGILLLMCERIFGKLANRYINLQEFKYDVYMFAVERVLLMWKSFNHLKYDVAGPYYTEMIKRAFAMGYNILVLRKRNFTDAPPTFLRISQYV